jgi:hypothetical protein
MDLALLFFMPLLGGYFFVRKCVLTRYRSAHAETSQIYYQAALVGCLLAAAGALTHLMLTTHSADYAAITKDANAHLIEPLLDKGDSASTADALTIERRAKAARARATVALTCVWAFALGLTAPLWNLVVRLAIELVYLPYLALVGLLRLFGWQRGSPPMSATERLNRRAITDELERLLYETMVHGELVQLSLDNSKVYVGLVRSVDPIGPAKHVTLQPLVSGGRDASGRDVQYTTYYDKVMRTVIAADPRRKQELLRRFQVVVPLGRIVTASGFDMAAFGEFSALRTPARPSTRVS